MRALDQSATVSSWSLKRGNRSGHLLEASHHDHAHVGHCTVTDGGARLEMGGWRAKVCRLEQQRIEGAERNNGAWDKMR